MKTQWCKYIPCKREILGFNTIESHMYISPILGPSAIKWNYNPLHHTTGEWDWGPRALQLKSANLPIPQNYKAFNHCYLDSHFWVHYNQNVQKVKMHHNKKMLSLTNRYINTPAKMWKYRS